jgi:phosphoglycolate phosphatase-like HAD superfamily hydrolase
MDVEAYERIIATHESDDADMREWWGQGKKELIGALYVAHQQRAALLVEVERLRLAEVEAEIAAAPTGLRLLGGGT